MMRKIFSLLCVCWILTLSAQAAEPAADFSMGLRAEQWDRLRQGDALLKQPELASMVQRWMHQPDSIIELRYPGGEEGEIWVQDVVDWLVALGVPSAAMQALPGSGTNDTIYLVLVTQHKK